MKRLLALLSGTMLLLASAAAQTPAQKYIDTQIQKDPLKGAVWGILARRAGAISIGGKPWPQLLLEATLIFYCLAGTTLVREVCGVFRAVNRSLEEGRNRLSRIVGRDTARLSAQEIRTAALETLAENLSDGVVAPLFWLVLLGVPGMMAYKMVNTLDSMIGYRTERYLDFGRFAARTDDAANWIPARLTALLMLLCAGRPRLASFVLRYGRAHLSPNSGYPEAALAGILDCRFGGTHDYFGQAVEKPYIGETDRELGDKDLCRSVILCRLTETLCIGTAAAIAFL